MRSPLRAFIDAVELPNHETAIRNLDYSNPRLRIERPGGIVYVRAMPLEWLRQNNPLYRSLLARSVPNRLYGTTLTDEGEAI
jgi:hypothetical protein